MGIDGVVNLLVPLPRLRLGGVLDFGYSTECSNAV